MNPFLIVFVGAGLGGSIRHAINLLGTRLFGTELPLATPITNILGSFLMRVLGGWFLLRTGSSQSWRLFLTTGVLGGFTTFSTFSLEAALLYERGELAGAALYVAGSVGLSIAALFTGLAFARHFGAA